MRALGIKIQTEGLFENPQFITVKRVGKVLRYTPYDIETFGLKNEKTYVSKEVALDNKTVRLFLEVLVEGDISLYQYGEDANKRFYYSEGNKTIQIGQGDGFLDFLLGDCFKSVNAVKLAEYKRNDLIKIFNMRNACSDKPMPFRKQGFVIGSKFVSMQVPNSFVRDFNFDYQNSFLLGYFVDIPIKMTYFSFNGGAYLNGGSFKGSLEEGDYLGDLLVRTTSMHLPALIQYTFPSSRISPFVNVGGKITLNIRNAATIYDSEVNGNVIQINEPESISAISTVLVGFVSGIGLQYHLNYRRRISGEIRVSSSYGNNQNLSQQEISLVAGFSF